MTLTVHHLQVSQSERIVWLCEELGIDYELQLHQRDPVLSPKAIQDLHAMKAAPIIVDDSAPGLNNKPPPLVLAESGAIVEYIIQKYGGGRLTLPPSHPNYADYLYWLHFSNGNLQSVMSRSLLLAMAQLPAAHPVMQMISQRTDVALQHFNDAGVTGKKWLAGDEFTAADIMTVFSLTTMRMFGQCDLSGYPAILEYLKRVGERPAYQKAMAKGDPGMKPALDGPSPPLFPGLIPK